MNPDERALLEQSLKVSLENNQLLRKMNRRARWSTAWEFIKIAVLVVPLIVGYFFLQPYINDAFSNYQNLQTILSR